MALQQENARSEKIELGDVNEKNLGLLKLLNSSIFPVKYNDKFYRDLLAQPDELTKLAYFGDVLIAAVCCRFEPNLETKQTSLYIMTLGVLPTYQRNGTGTFLLEYVLNTICKSHPEVTRVYLHVQVNNEVALRLYRKYGFQTTDIIRSYYKKIEPPDCFVVEKLFPPQEQHAK